MNRLVKCRRNGNPTKLINRMDAGSLSSADNGPCGEGTISRRKVRLRPLHLQYNQAIKNRVLVASNNSATGDPFKVPQMFTQAKTSPKRSCPSVEPRAN